jgi:carbonic anhydrase/acetyltransferase-like protein (isoleucine patch superfamily)
MAVYRVGNKTPEIAVSAYIADTATVIGDVWITEGCSVWPGAVIRGDNAPIRIGRQSNLQDNAVAHGSPGCPLTVGEGVTVGHGATLHGCTIGDRCLIGIQAVVLDKVEVGTECLVAAGAVLRAGTKYPPRSLIAGVPAEVRRPLTDAEVAKLAENGERYVRDAAMYRETLERLT